MEGKFNIGLRSSLWKYFFLNEIARFDFQKRSVSQVNQLAYYIFSPRKNFTSRFNTRYVTGISFQILVLKVSISDFNLRKILCEYPLYLRYSITYIAFSCYSAFFKVA